MAGTTAITTTTTTTTIITATTTKAIRAVQSSQTQPSIAGDKVMTMYRQNHKNKSNHAGMHTNSHTHTHTYIVLIYKLTQIKKNIVEAVIKGYQVWWKLMKEVVAD